MVNTPGARIGRSFVNHGNFVDLFLQNILALEKAFIHRSDIGYPE
jgi:hypothetical protein